MKKKVLFSATVDSHILNFHIPYLKYFKEKGYQVHVATNGTEKIPYCDVKHIIPFERSPFKINNLRAIAQLKKVIDRESFEIIHTHTPMGSVVTRIAALGARKQLKTKVMYTAHGFHFFKDAPSLNWILFYPAERILARYTDVLITINQEDYNLAKKKFNTRVEYIPGVGIDSQRLNSKLTLTQKKALRKSLGLNKDDYVLIYPAELSKRKQQRWLIESLSNLIVANQKIHLLLPGKDSLDGKLQEYTEQLGISKNIHFLGFRQDVSELLMISNLAVSSARQEGLPINILEAMNAGLPVVATDCRGNRDLVKNNIGGYILPLSDKQGFSAAVVKIISDDKTAKTFSVNNIVASREFSLQKVISRMDRIYARRRIVHLLGSSVYSGAEKIVFEIIQNTPENYSSYYCSPEGKINAFTEQSNIKHLGISRLNLWNVRRIQNKIRPDVIHAHDFKASLVASFLSANSNVISHIHQRPKWSDTNSLRTLIYHLRLKSFTKVVTITPKMKQAKIFKGLPDNKAVTLRNYVDSKQIKSKGKIYEGEHYNLAFIGRLEKEKNPFDFIKTVHKIYQEDEKVKAVIIGDGSLNKACTKLVEQLGLSSNIDLVGYAKNPYGYIRNTDFVMITSEAEGFGLVAAESIILETLVLSYDIAGINEIFRSKSILLCKDNTTMIKRYWELKNNNRLYKTALADSLKDVSGYTGDSSAWRKQVKMLYQGLGDER
jgi:glycosyltransferase EpsD